MADGGAEDRGEVVLDMGEELGAEYAEGLFPGVAEGAHPLVSGEVEVVVPVGKAPPGQRG